MADIKKILVIFKTHLDIGFTNMAAKVVQQYDTAFIPAALRCAEQMRNEGEDRFLWTTGSWLVDHHLCHADPTGAMAQAIARGDISWHALPFTTHTELMDEDLFRHGLAISHKLDERFGRTTLAAKMTDVPGHTRSMVPLLAEAGVRFLHIGVNAACPSPDVPTLFNWRVDGCETLVMYNPGYGQFTELADTGTAVFFAHTNDNMGPQSTAEVHEVYTQLRADFPNAQVVAADLNDIAHALLPIGSTLPVYEGEIGDTWIHGAGTHPRKMFYFRELMRALPEIDPPLRERVRDGMLLVCEHTWGLDEKTWLGDFSIYEKEAFNAHRGDEKFAVMERSWEEQAAYLTDAVGALPLPERTHLQALMAQYRSEPLDLAAYEALPCTDVALHVNGYEVHVSASGAIDRLCKGTQHLADAQHQIGQVLYQVFSAADYEQYFSQYAISDVDWAVKDLTKPGMEAGVDVHIDATAQLCGLYRKGDELLAMLALPAELSEKYGAPRKLALRYRFDDDALRMELLWWEKPASRVAEALWCHIHPIGTQPHIRKLGRYIDPLTVCSKGGRDMHATDLGVRYDEVLVKSLDAPLVSLGRPSLLSFDDQLPDTTKGLYFNLYNNKWGTNFPMWYDEDARFRWDIVPFAEK